MAATRSRRPRIRWREAIALATEVHQRGQEAPGDAFGGASRGSTAVQQELAVRAAVPAWVDPVAAAGLAVAAGGGGKQVMEKEIQMKSRNMNSSGRNAFGRLSIVAVPCALALLCSLPLYQSKAAIADFDTKP